MSELIGSYEAGLLTALIVVVGLCALFFAEPLDERYERVLQRKRAKLARLEAKDRLHKDGSDRDMYDQLIDSLTGPFPLIATGLVWLLLATQGIRWTMGYDVDAGRTLVNGLAMLLLIGIARSVKKRRAKTV